MFISVYVICVYLYLFVFNLYLSVLYCAELTTAEKYCFSDPHCSGEKLFNGHVTTESNCCDDETAMSWGSLTQGVCQSCGQGKDHYSFVFECFGFFKSDYLCFVYCCLLKMSWFGFRSVRVFNLARFE